MPGWRGNFALVNIAFATLAAVPSADSSGNTRIIFDLRGCKTSPRKLDQKIAISRAYDVGSHNRLILHSTTQVRWCCRGLLLAPPSPNINSIRIWSRDNFRAAILYKRDNCYSLFFQKPRALMKHNPLEITKGSKERVVALFSADGSTHIRATGNTRGICRWRPRHQLRATKVLDHNNNHDDDYDYNEAEKEKDHEETILSEGKKHSIEFVPLLLLRDLQQLN